LSYFLNKLKLDIEGLSLPGYFVWLIFCKWHHNLLQKYWK
jgi:hypothetical protein